MEEASPHILIVDDQADIRDTLRDVFEAEGYHVTLADGGAQVREVLAAEVVDVILMDARLFGETGLHLAEFAETLHVPVLMMSGDELASEGFDNASRANIRKPFRIVEVTKRIAEVMRASRKSGLEPRRPQPTSP